MISDPIVDEIRSIREKLAAQFNFDIRKIVEDAQKRQANSQSRVVSFQLPKQPLQPTKVGVLVVPNSEAPKATSGGSS